MHDIQHHHSQIYQMHSTMLYITQSSLHYWNGLKSDTQTQLTNLNNKFTADTGISVAGLLTDLARSCTWSRSTFQNILSRALKAPNFEVDQNGSLGVTGNMHCNTLYPAANINAGATSTITGYAGAMSTITEYSMNNNYGQSNVS